MSIAQETPAIREVPHCKYCDSTDIVFDATAAWDAKEQTFVLLDTMDDVMCGYCRREGHPVWKTVPTDTSVN